MLRAALLWLSERPAVFDFIKRNGMARRMARRFVAGEGLEHAEEATRELNGRDVTVTLDPLGESVRSADEAASARDTAITILDRIHETGLAANISLKLTQMGLDLDPELAADNMCTILERARSYETFVRIDMEASDYVQPTLDLFAERLHPEYGATVGVVIQSMLRRSAEDVERLIELHARVRLVKGAYMEPGEVAFPDKRDVDDSFAQLAERLLASGNYPAVATHDERLIEHARAYAAAHEIKNGAYEFQMLYGVRRDLMARLRAAGHNMRIYVPFGTDWYPYLMRRLAERPANLAFIAANIVRETFARS